MFRKIIFLVAYVLVFGFGMPFAEPKAQTVQVSASASLTYSGDATPAVKERALQNARLSAFKKFMALQPQARKSVYARLEAKFRATLDTIIVEHVIQREKDDTENKKYSVLIVAKIDPNEVDRLFDDLGGGKKLEGDFGALFIARVAKSAKAYDVKRTRISASNSAEKVRETSVGSGGKSLDAVERSKFSKKQTGGSAERKRNKVVYVPNLELSNTIQEAIGEFLINANFEPMEYTELEGVPFLDELIEANKFRSDGNLPTRIAISYKKAAQKAGWKYFGLGTISVGLPMNDPVRGNLKVAAQVSFKVFELTSRRAKTVATVRKKTVFSFGNDPSVLETDAANKAAELAIKTVIGQLQKRALR